MILHGRNPIAEALRRGEVEKVWLARGVDRNTENSVTELCKQMNVPLERVPRAVLDEKLGGVVHQGVMASVASLQFSDEGAMWQLANERGEAPLFVLLDGITDPHNFGAIVRSAEVLGAHGVVVEERRSAPLNATVAKVSAGAASHLPIVQVKNLPRFIEALQKEAVWVFGAAGEAAQPLDRTDLSGPVAIVIGSEGDGLRRLVRERCDALVSIPVRGKVSSLNASVAAGILIAAAAATR